MHYVGIKQELFAIVDSVRHFRGVLQGHPVSIVTAHMPLTGLFKSPQTNFMLIRWRESLSQFDTTIARLEGTQYVIADTLSRIYHRIKIPPEKIVLLHQPLSTALENNNLLQRTTFFS